LFIQYAVFEPGTRNTGKGLVGKNIANPIAMLSASAELLDHLGLDFHAGLLQDAIYKTVNIDRVHTPGLMNKCHILIHLFTYDSLM